jgi:asparagine N-glycosylation enzyme membrane subunit Stt3
VSRHRRRHPLGQAGGLDRHARGAAGWLVGTAVGHLLLQSFWANEAIFQLMMLAYNLFLLFKMDFAGEAEYRQQIKTFRLKYIFLAGKIIRTARSVVMKLSEKYPYREIYEKSLS